MATKTLPAHGTYARANGSHGYREPCKCGPCVKKWRRTRKQLRVNRQLGKAARIDPTPARQHLDLLRQTMTWQQIGTAANCEAHTLQWIYHGSQSTIRRATQARILAVRPQPVTAPGKYLDATGIRRRIQALRAIGYSIIVIADAAQSAHTRIQLISTGKQQTVRYQLAAKILDAYRALATTPAPPGRSSTMARSHAAAQGWAPPGAWDDDTIDDPAAAPELYEERKLGRDELAAYRHREMEHLASYGVPEREIAERLDMAPAYVHDLLRDLRTAARGDRKQVAA